MAEDRKFYVHPAWRPRAEARAAPADNAAKLQRRLKATSWRTYAWRMLGVLSFPIWFPFVTIRGWWSVRKSPEWNKNLAVSFFALFVTSGMLFLKTWWMNDESDTEA